MKRAAHLARWLLPALALAAPTASATRSPANLAPFNAGHVCVGRADVQVGDQPNAALTQTAQDALTKLAASLQLNGANQPYTDCPAWLFFQARAQRDADGHLVYASTLSLIAPGVHVQSLADLKGDAFPYDGDFEYVNLWSETDAHMAFDLDNLAFRLRADVVSGMDAFSADWKRSHPPTR